MSKGPLILFALLSVSLALAKTKSYSVRLDQPARVANHQLQPGDYKLTLKGAQAVLTSEKDHKSITTPAKVEQASRKYEYTGVELNKTGTAERLEGIELGGTNLLVHFNN